MTNATQYLERPELLAMGFASVGKHVFVSRDATIVHPERVHIGDMVRIDPFSLIIAKQPVRIGSHVHIGSSVTLHAAEEIAIGDFSGLSAGTKVFTTDDDYGGEYLTGPTVDPRFTNIATAPVVLYEHCIVGANCVILPGAVLEQGAAVGALSLIKGTLAAWTIYGGSPVRRLKERSRGLLTKATQLQGAP
jgi:galactoside O-acetyltransferase